MADNLTIPATGTGTATPVVATDDVSSVHFQKVKLDVGGDGASVAALGDSTGRLLVCPSSNLIRVQVTPTISSSPAYTSGDCIGGLQEITNAARVSGGSGVLQAVTILDKTQAQRSAIDLLFFDRSVTVAGDNAAVATSDADMAYCLGVITIGPYNTAWPGTPLNSLSTLININLPFVLTATSLYCQAVARSTPTYTSTSDLIFSYLIYRD
jgi:hypothetical protein